MIKWRKKGIHFVFLDYWVRDDDILFDDMVNC